MKIESVSIGLQKKKKDHRLQVGGLWNEIGRFQFDFLISCGLKKDDFFLDVGCGSLRGGVHFIQYLKNGHYFGIDKDKELLDAGNFIELKKYNLSNKKPNLKNMSDFNFKSLNQRFDYALAQSVFTHLNEDEILKCLTEIEKVLVKGGKFYATFFENPRNRSKLEPLSHRNRYGPDIVTYYDKDPFHYNYSTFEKLCEKIPLRVDYIGDWNHPRTQKMMIFTKV